MEDTTATEDVETQLPLPIANVVGTVIVCLESHPTKCAAGTALVQ